jgi:UDP-N-acetyl-2-amino-2-deoxyglucuronate dehydrogenase
MGKELRVGLIGGGGIAGAHMKAYRQLDGVKVVAVAEIVGDRLQSFGDTWAIPGRYGDYQIMLEREALDVVSVCTPPNAHCAATVATAEAGVRAIFCEKPMAMTLAEADRMLAACKRAGAKLQIDHVYRFETNFRQVKNLVAEGAIGDLIMIAGKCVGPPRNPQRYDGQYRLNGGGWLMAQGTHLFDLFRLYGGDPLWAVASVQRWRPQVDIEDAANGLFKLHNGVMAHFEVSGNRVDRSFAFMVELEGSSGRLHISDAGGKPYLYLWKYGDRQVIGNP